MRSVPDQTEDASGVLSRLVVRAGVEPIEGVAADGTVVRVDQEFLAEAVYELDIAPLVVAAVADEGGNSQPLLDYGAEHPHWYQAGLGDIEWFSGGANLSGWCNDQDDPYDLNDPVDVRREKLYGALAALPEDVYAPWSKEATQFYSGFDQCVEWPSPDDRSEPALPDNTPTSAFPVLALSGELDRLVPTETSRRLLETYPDASFVIVAGADHPTLSSGLCVANLIADFIETLEPLGERQCDG